MHVKHSAVATSFTRISQLDNHTQHVFYFLNIYINRLDIMSVKVCTQIMIIILFRRNFYLLYNYSRMATAVNKQLNFTVKNKPHTTNYIYCIFMIKSV